MIYQQIHFIQIIWKIVANNMSNIHVSPNVLSNLMLLQRGKLYNLQQEILHSICRSSRPEVFCKKDALKTYGKFTGKNLCWSLFIIKLQAFRFQYRCFPVSFTKFLRTPIFKNIWEQLFLHLKYCTPANNTAEPVAKYS